MAHISLRESRDNVAKSQEGLVDGLGLLQCEPLGVGLLHLLRASQIHEVELP